MANRIPRAAKKLEVTWLLGNSACRAGTTAEAYKNEYGWHMDIGDTTYYVFADHLRNENLCKIKVLA